MKSKPVELGEGYSICVSYEGEGPPEIQVKTYGKIDFKELVKEIRRKYPRAKIYGLENRPAIEVSSKPRLKRRKERLKKRRKERKKRQRT